MKRNNKFIAIIFLLVPLLIVPLDWYRDLAVNPVTFQRENVNGLFVMSTERARIGLLYVLCIIVQISVLKTKQIIFPILSTTILLIILITFPIYLETIMYLNISDIIHYYGIGCYLTIVSLLISLGFQIYQSINKNNKS